MGICVLKRSNAAKSVSEKRGTGLSPCEYVIIIGALYATWNISIYRHILKLHQGIQCKFGDGFVSLPQELAVEDSIAKTAHLTLIREI